MKHSRLRRTSARRARLGGTSAGLGMAHKVVFWAGIGEEAEDGLVKAEG